MRYFLGFFSAIRFLLYTIALLSTFLMISYGRMFFDSVYVNIYWVLGLALSSWLASKNDLHWKGLVDVVVCVLLAVTIVLLVAWVFGEKYIKSAIVFYIKEIGYSGGALLFCVSVFIIFCVLIEYRFFLSKISD